MADPRADHIELLSKNENDAVMDAIFYAKYFELCILNFCLLFYLFYEFRLSNLANVTLTVAYMQQKQKEFVNGSIVFRLKK